MLKRLSTTKLNLYIQCGRKFKIRYIDGNYGDKISAYMVQGTVAHNAAESFIISEGRGKTLAERFAHYWPQELAERGGSDAINWYTSSESGFRKEGINLFNTKSVIDGISEMRALMVDGKPMVEHYFEFDIPGVGLPYCGFVDIVEDDGVPGDFKTSNKPWKASKASESLQAALYLEGLKSEGFECPGDLFRFHVLQKNPMKFVKFEFAYPQAKRDWFLSLVRDAWRGIQAGSFPPCETTHWLCSKKWCEYWDLCKS